MNGKNTIRGAFAGKTCIVFSVIIGYNKLQMMSRELER